jgi:hypothetical protein
MWSAGDRTCKEPEMDDVAYVALTVVTFAVFALVVKGVERLER